MSSIRRRIAVVTVGLGLLLATPGCWHHGLEPRPEVPPDPIDRSAFDYESTPVTGTLTALAAESPEYETAALSFPADDRDDAKNETVRAIFRSPISDARGFVIVYPVMGGDYEPSEAFAQDLAERGFRSLRFDRKVDVFDAEGDFELVARRLRQSVIDVRRALDWALAEKFAQPGEIGLVGLSLGSIIGSLVASVDERVSATVLIIGGGDLVATLDSAAGEQEVATLLAKLRERGFDEQEIHAQATAAFASVEPLNFAAGMDRETTLMIHARFDDVVPYERGTALWQAAGEPERLTIPTGHYTAALYLPYLLSETADFLESHLRPATPAAG